MKYHHSGSYAIISKPHILPACRQAGCTYNSHNEVLLHNPGSKTQYMLQKVILIITICSYLVSCQTEDPNINAKINFLKHNAVPINNDSYSYDFRDLNSIRDKVKDAQIVMLGEPTHSSGAAIQAKVRLVKFLHEEMGFNVLVMESSMFDCSYAWDMIRSGQNPDTAIARGIFPVWAKSKQFKPLIDYIADNLNTDNELELAGFDIQLTGNVSIQKRRELLYSHLKSIDSTATIYNYSSLSDFFINPKEYMMPANYSTIDSTTKADIVQELVHLTQRFESVKSKDRKSAIYHRFLLNLERFLYFRWNLNTNNILPEIANVRDQEMGANLIWLKETLYPDQKLIVWGATSHLIHNREKLQYVREMIPMGDYVEKHFGDSSIVLAVTAFDGTIGSHVSNYNLKVHDASNKSIEYLLNKSGFNHAYLDIQSPDFKQAIGNEFTARFLGYTNQKANWSEMLDGLIFINTMTPNTKHVELNE